jgi:hypothetical protein
VVNIAKRHSEADGPDFLRQAFARVHKRLAFELMHAAETITHDGERGRSTENDWVTILRSYLPRRYAVDGGIAVDSLGRTSDQIDVIIFDQQYTPALLETATVRLIPAEAIYAVFDAKPEVAGTTLNYAADKAASVRRLKRTSVPIVHAASPTGHLISSTVRTILLSAVRMPGWYSLCSGCLTSFSRWEPCLQLTGMPTLHCWTLTKRHSVSDAELACECTAWLSDEPRA